MAIEEIPHNRHLELVGKIASQWAKLEGEIDYSIWRLAEMPPNLGACITTSFVSVFPKLKALAGLAYTRGASKTTVKPLIAFRNGLYDTAEKRNRAVHDRWIPLGGHEATDMAQRTITVSNSGMPINALTPVTTASLEGTLQEITIQISRYEAVMSKIYDELSSRKMLPAVLPVVVPNRYTSTSN